MPKICVECNTAFPFSKVIDGKVRNLSNRTKCLDCQPFMSSIRANSITLTEEEKQERFHRCGREKQKRYYDKFKLEHGVDPISLRRYDRKEFIISLIGGKCQICDYVAKVSRNLAFHHIKDKLFDLSSYRFQLSLKVVLPEIFKCIIVCHNCHGEIHDGFYDIELINNENKRLIDVLGHLNNKNWSDVLIINQN